VNLLQKKTAHLNAENQKGMKELEREFDVCRQDQDVRSLDIRDELSIAVFEILQATAS
jgi:hypothetical protein